MLEAVFALARPLLNALDPEQAHELTLRSLEAGIYPRNSAPDDGRLATNVWGLAFPNPLGIAAGFDKDARVVGAVLGMGLGFAEIGTVTPRPQQGNPRPRVFRLGNDGAIINRLGFNNGGHAAALARLEARPPARHRRHQCRGQQGCARSRGRLRRGHPRFYDVAGYFTVNVSSPNTPGLRDLQAPAALDDLLARVLAARSQLIAAGKPRRPIVVKLAPDLAEADLEPVVGVLVARGVDGIAIGNTTLGRPGLSDPALAKRQAGSRGARCSTAPPSCWRASTG